MVRHFSQDTELVRKTLSMAAEAALQPSQGPGSRQAGLPVHKAQAPEKAAFIQSVRGKCFRRSHCSKSGTEVSSWSFMDHPQLRMPQVQTKWQKRFGTRDARLQHLAPQPAVRHGDFFSDHPSPDSGAQSTRLLGRMGQQTHRRLQKPDQALASHFQLFGSASRMA